MAKQSARKKAGLGPPPPRKAPPVRSKGAPPTQQRNRKIWIAGGAGIAALVALAIVLAVVLTGKSSGSSTSENVVVPWAEIPGLQMDPPPWNNSSAVLSERLSLLHLKALGQEGTALHIHQHLDVYVNGKKVAVPAGIGIDEAAGFLTELHTHDASGIIHVESPTDTTFTLGQFFGEWGVKLTANCLGRYCGKVSWWVNGVKRSGNPAQLVLREHQEIAVAAGTAPAHPPKSYTFPQGL